MPVDVGDIQAVETDGGFNLRDFGGYKTTDGRTVKRGMLYRSGTMAMLGEEDEQRLRDLGIRVVFDLRRKDERQRAPTRWHVEAMGVEYWARDYEETSGIIGAMLRVDETGPDVMREAMVSLYRRIPVDHAASYQSIFSQLVETGGPLLVNCSAGKDRTGVAAALILSALGVSRKDVMRDYLMTNQAADWAKMFASDNSKLSQIYHEKPEMLAPLLAADAIYLETMFDALECDHGGFANYLNDQLGVGTAELVRLRDALLEP